MQEDMEGLFAAVRDIALTSKVTEADTDRIRKMIESMGTRMPAAPPCTHRCLSPAAGGRACRSPAKVCKPSLGAPLRAREAAQLSKDVLSAKRILHQQLCAQRARR
jgi:hypothetical protein